MPVLSFSDSDLRSGMPLEAGWYKGVIKSFKTEMNKAKDNINYVPVFQLQDGSSEGREQKTWISPKARGWQIQITKLYCALKEIPLDMKAAKVDTDEMEEIAKHTPQLWVHLTVGPDSTGRLQNSPDDYLPASAPDPTTPAF